MNKPYHETERASLFSDLSIWSLVAGMLVVVLHTGVVAGVFLLGTPLLPSNAIIAPIWILLGLVLLSVFLAIWGFILSIIAFFDCNCRRTVAVIGFSLNGPVCLLLLILLGSLGAAYS